MSKLDHCKEIWMWENPPAPIKHLTRIDTLTRVTEFETGNRVYIKTKDNTILGYFIYSEFLNREQNPLRWCNITPYHKKRKIDHESNQSVGVSTRAKPSSLNQTTNVPNALKSLDAMSNHCSQWAIPLWDIGDQTLENGDMFDLTYWKYDE